MKSTIEDILFGLYRISRALRKVPLDSPDGLSMHHWFALHIIAEGRANVSLLAKELNVMLPTATALVEQLVQNGLVERTPSPTDRRVAMLSLTAGGKQQIATVKSQRVDRATKLFQALTPAELAELKRLVDTLVAGVESGAKEQERGE